MKVLSRTSRWLLIAIFIVLTIFAVYGISVNIEKQNIRNEITDYLSEEHGLENIKIEFIEPGSTYKYRVEVYSSNLNSLSYEKMTRIEYYFSSHTSFEPLEVEVWKYICGKDSYMIFPKTVYKNGEPVYEYTKKDIVVMYDKPFIGMKDDYIGNTKLGKPDKTELCRDYYALRPERRSVTYRWYDHEGKTICCVRSHNGEVTSVIDYRT